MISYHLIWGAYRGANIIRNYKILSSTTICLFFIVIKSNNNGKTNENISRRKAVLSLLSILDDVACRI